MRRGFTWLSLAILAVVAAACTGSGDDDPIAQPSVTLPPVLASENGTPVPRPSATRVPDETPEGRTPVPQPTVTEAPVEAPANGTPVPRPSATTVPNETPEGRTRVPQPSVTEVPLEVSEQGGPAEYSTDELTIRAAELLRRSDEVMRALDFVRVFTTDPGAEHGFQIDELVEQPGMLRRLSSASIEPVGGMATWREELPDPTARAVPWFFDRAGGKLGRGEGLETPAHDVRLVGESEIDGREVWVLWYWYTQRPGVTTWFTEWIEKETLWLLRQETNIKDGQNSRDGQLRMLFDFDDRAAPPRYPIELPPASLRRFTETLVTVASADTHVRENRAERNFGADRLLRAEGAPWLRTLLRFEVGGLPAGATILSARVGLHVRDAAVFDQFHAEGSSARIGAIHIAEGAWDEGTVTWLDAPSVGAWVAEIGSTEGFPSPERTEFARLWAEGDVTAVVTGNGRYDFYVINETSAVGPQMASREVVGNGPILVITYEYTEPPIVPTASIETPVVVSRGGTPAPGRSVAGVPGETPEGRIQIPQPSVTEVPGEVVEDGGPAEYSTPGLPISAAELLRRSDEAMQALDFVRVFTTDASVSSFDIRELTEQPGMLRRISEAWISPVGGVPTWRELPPGSTARAEPGLFDRSAGALGRPEGAGTPAQTIRLVDEGEIDGREVWVLWYQHTGLGIPRITTWFTEWIDKETLWLLRQETNNDDGPGIGGGDLRMLFDFNDRAAPPSYPIEFPPARLRRFNETLVTAASDDSYVQESWPDGNFGAEEQLRAEGAPWFRTLLGFDVSGLPEGAEILSARLGLYVRTAPILGSAEERGASVRIGAAHVAEGAWDEDSVTWENAPSLGRWLGEVGSTLGFPSPERAEFTDVWVEVDVTSAVSGNGRYDFYVINETDLVGPRFSSSESGANGPILVITYEFTEPPLVPVDSVTR